MANWSSNVLKVEGTKEGIDRLENVLSYAIDNDRIFYPDILETYEKGLVYTGMMGSDVHNLCIKLLDRDNRGDVSIRGYINYIDREDDTVLMIEEESAWGPLTDFYKLFHKLFFDDEMEVYYLAYEPGCDIYETNDIDCVYFGYNYDYCLDDELSGLQYLNDTDFIKEVSDILDHPNIETPEEAMALVDNYNNDVNNCDYHIGYKVLNRIEF